MKLSDSRPAVLVTGGAGYVGAHTCKTLWEGGYLPVAYDNLIAGFQEAVRWGPLIQGDILDASALAAALGKHKPVAVIHFAGLIEVGRSHIEPGEFWNHNLGGTMVLLSALRAANVPRLIFSSSAAVYGVTERAGAIEEDAPKNPVSPYGETKLACEWAIRAACHAHGLTAIALRYFNAAGADPRGAIGEAHAPETHLLPLAISAALGERTLTIFGNDFDTPDGTCLRDYVHVNDLAAAHVSALELELATGRFEAVNLGGGRGRSVLEVVEAVQHILRRPVPHSIGPRRVGDPAHLVADISRARQLLGWQPVRSSLEEIVADAIAWEQSPGYGRRERRARASVVRSD